MNLAGLDLAILGPALLAGLLVLATGVSAAVSFVAVKWLLGFVQTHTFKGFGWYRIGVGTVLLVILLG